MASRTTARVIIFTALIYAQLCMGGSQRPTYPPELIYALNQVEASGKKSGVRRGDSGNAIGSFQIHKAYWIDSGIEGKWEDCEDYDYSVRVVLAYADRYEPEAVTTRDLRTLSMLHHYGCNWRKRNDDPHGYWGKVQGHLAQYKSE